ncbi:MAG: histidinol-phosphate aminotransferase family protein [Candidatus Cloacimonetes bacterium]|nr:histidinol-phosphate aminotransferase family protein [Candidatus Cloacimonadota bacterium]MBT6993405.1 histidinol-phosphate aminotransferase family protein [Candidatus Cloacimonadota bacterium]
MYYFRDDLQQKKPINIDVPHKKTMMCLNESSLNPLERIQTEFLEKMKNVPLNRYFNNITGQLKNALSEYTKLPADHLIFGNGADEMLFTIFNAVRNDNNSFAVSLAPSYFDYKSYSGAVGLGMKFLYLDENFDFSVDEYLKLCDDENCKLAVLCNPNNPTGNLLPDEKIMQILENFKGLVLIDETYFEFSGKTFADKINLYPNLVIVRSFSKSFSSAGLRFGYIISQPQNIRELEKAMTIFHLNLMTQSFVLTLLENKDIFLNHTKQVIENKQVVFNELNAINGLKVHPSATNFLTFTIGEKTENLYNFLAENDIAIRAVWHHPVLKNHVRVSISNANDNAQFLNYVKKFMSKFYE